MKYTERDIWLDNSRYKVKYYEPYIKDEWITELANYHRKIPLTDFSIREKLEVEIAKFMGSKYAVCVNSGTSAILMGMIACSLKPGDEVIGPNYGHPAWLNCCRLLGLKPIPVDIKESTMCIDPEEVYGFASRNTKAIVFLNHAGYVGEDVEKISNFCFHRNIMMIEDSCSAMGQRYKGVNAGVTGHVGSISFGPKLICCGEGGAALTSNDYIYKKLKELQYQAGWYTSNRKNIKIGGNFNMPPQNAFYVLQQLGDIEDMLRKRAETKRLYRKYGIDILEYNTDRNTGYSFYIINSKNSANIHRVADKLGVQTSYKPYTPFHKIINYDGDFPISEKMTEESLYLPHSISMSEDDIKMIKASIKMGDR